MAFILDIRGEDIYDIMLCVGWWGWSGEDWLRRGIELKLLGSVKEGGPWFEQGGRGHLRRGIITHTLSGVEQGSQKTYISHKRHHPNTKIFLANLAWHPGVATQRGMAALFMWFCWSILSRSPEFTNVPLTDIISHCILQTPPSPIQPQSQILYHQIPKYIMN